MRSPNTASIIFHLQSILLELQKSFNSQCKITLLYKKANLILIEHISPNTITSFMHKPNRLDFLLWAKQRLPHTNRNCYSQRLASFSWLHCSKSIRLRYKTHTFSNSKYFIYSRIKALTLLNN